MDSFASCSIQLSVDWQLSYLTRKPITQEVTQCSGSDPQALMLPAQLQHHSTWGAQRAKSELQMLAGKQNRQTKKPKNKTLCLVKILGLKTWLRLWD